MWWQDFRSSGSTDIPVNGSAWHHRLFQDIIRNTDDTGLISRVSLLLYWALLRLLHSNWVIRSSIEAHCNVLKSTGLSWPFHIFIENCKQSFSSENLKLMPFLKFSRLWTLSISSSSDMFSNWLLVHNSKLKDRCELGKNGNGYNWYFCFQQSYRTIKSDLNRGSIDI